MIFILGTRHEVPAQHAAAAQQPPQPQHGEQRSTYRWRKARPPAAQRAGSEVKAHFRHNTIGQRQQLEQLSFAGTKPSERDVRQRGAKEVAAVTFLNVLKQLEAQRATQLQQKLQAKSSCCCTAIACSPEGCSLAAIA